MSNMNYNKMYEGDKEQKVAEVNPIAQQPAEVVAEPKQSVEPVVEPVVSEPKQPEQPKVPQSRKAIVCNCAKLNVRKNPFSNADVLEIVNAGVEVEVCNPNAKGKFYPVRTESGIEGFCMKDYLKLK